MRDFSKYKWVITILLTFLLIFNVNAVVTQYNFTVGSDTVCIFNGTGNITWQVPIGPPNITSVRYLIVAGGGGGGTRHGGGGGAGGLLTGITTNISDGRTYDITVGIGGVGDTNAGSGASAGGSGGFSLFSNISTTGGGGGGGGDTGNGVAGGSGGGAVGRFARTGGSNVSGQGFPGASTGGLGGWYGGGGGGAGAAALTVGSDTNGNGGDGILSNITGFDIYYGGGGGGANNASVSAGGLGGGGRGSGWSGNTGENATNNTGGGGGGGSFNVVNYVGGNGGSGIVIIRYGPPTISSFYASEISGFNGYTTLQVLFTDTSFYSPTSWNWSFGDGSYSNLQSPLHIYSVAGNYSISLNSSNVNGFNVTNPNYYWINVSVPVASPVSDFSGNHLTGIAPLLVQFTDNSVAATGWGWFFGDETYNQSWNDIVIGSPDWGGRTQHTSVALHDAELLIMGGVNSTGRMNDTWKSINYGSTWTEINASSGWSKRSDHATVLMPDGSIILMGGTDGTNNFNDTWRTTNEGLTWTLMNGSSGWSERYGLRASVINDTSNSIILTGGNSSLITLNDTWESNDYGATWTLMSDNPGWLSRSDHSSVVMQDGSIVIMGGGSGADKYNDTWRTINKGLTWVEQNPSSGWSSRSGLSSVRMPDNNIVIMGGIDSTPLNDVWRSRDFGSSWVLVNASSFIAHRYGHSSISMPNSSIIVIGGNGSYYLNDSWMFNPVSSTLENPSHLFSLSGQYNVSMRGYNFIGYNTTMKYSYITVFGPVALFNISPLNSAPIGSTVTFVDMSVNSPTSWNWSFGDGNYSSNQNTTHIYQSLGQFTVRLNASNGFGFSNSSQNYTIVPATPVSNFTISSNIGSSPLDVTFTDTSTGSGITDWFWIFGDGSTSTTASTVSHTYSSLGTYYAQLQVTSSAGSNLSQPITIYVVNSAIPIPDFIGSPISGSPPLSVQFTDLSASLLPINGWNWSFGDGNFSNIQNPVHIYSYSGQYSVRLTSTNGVFSNDTIKNGYINVGIQSSSVSADFVANTTSSSTYPATMQFNDLSVCNPACTQWAWDLNGDGAVDSLIQNPIYTYTYPGNYSPKLIVSNGLNSGTRVKNNYIIIGPAFVYPTITQPTGGWHPGYQYNGSLFVFKGTSYIDLPNSTFLKYWLQNFSATGNFSVYGFATGLMAPLMHVFGFWVFLIIWGLYLFAVWIRSQDVTLPLIIGILTMGTFGLLFPKESLPVIIIMFVICGAIIVTKLMKDAI